MFKKGLVLGLILAGLVSYSVAAEAQQERGYLILRGSASKEVEPNIAEISFTVENTNKDLKTAQADNNKTATAVVNALKAKLTKDKDVIKTGRISVNPNYTYSKDNKRTLRDYTAINSVTIRTGQVDNLSSMIDAALAAGANRMNGLNFIFTEEKKVCKDLYPEIISDLKSQINILTSGFGATTQGIKYLNASCGKQYSTMYRSNMVMSARAKGFSEDADESYSVPVESGKVKVDANIEIQVFVK